MKAKETYTLLISSQNATNRLGATKRNLQYYINWSSILPKSEDPGQKYQLKFVMTSLFTAAGFNDIYSLNIDFGGSNVFEQTGSKSSYIGLVYPSFVSTFNQYYYAMAKNNDNLPIIVEYPNNSLITVNLVNSTVGSGTVYNYEYLLTLQFTPI